MIRAVTYRAQRVDGAGMIESKSIDIHRDGRTFLKQYTTGTWFMWVEVDPKTMWIMNEF